MVRDWIRNGAYRLLYILTGEGRGVRGILLYHSVGSDSPHSIPASVFQQQMAFLAEHFKVVRLCDLAKAIAVEPPENNIACVSFDDGYQDNYEVALPILDRFGIKAVFFITTGFLGKKFPTFAGPVPVMTSKQVLELAVLGHEIGAHTVNHPKLTRLMREIARKEIHHSKEELENLTQCPVVSFAYPKGDYDPVVREMVARCGFGVAVTVQQGLLYGSLDWLALPRIWVSSRLDTRGFSARMSPAADWYRRLRSWTGA